MRQTFFHELQELEKREKTEKREKVQLYLRSKSIFLRDSLPWVSIFLVAFFSVSVALYVIYLFFDFTKINEVANVHFTDNIKLAVRSAQGNIFNDPEKDIKNWLIYRNSENKMEIAYPSNWVSEKKSNHIFEIKKYNSQRSLNESLAARIFLDELQNEKQKDFLMVVSENSGLKIDNLKQGSTLANFKFLESGKQRDKIGFLYNEIYWQKGQKIFRLKIIYYNQNNRENEEIFEKIILELKI